MAQGFSRREAIKLSALGLATAAGGWLTAVSADSQSPRALRFAHPTDIHVQPELGGAEGMAAALRHMMNLADPPQMILNGGDLPMDVAATGRERSEMLWKLFKSILADNVPTTIPVHHAIGNHDIWGRDKGACGARGDEPFYGKNWYLQEMGYSRTYYSFDMAGWHFVVLDSFDLDKDGKEYTSRIVGEQLEWLKSDLATNSLPTVVMTHVPIVSAANFFDHETTIDDQDILIPRTRMHVDFAELSALFRRYPNIKLCLSGHLHLLDRVEYDGITYICDGAVCGDKWKGPRLQTPEGYGLIDLFADGTFTHQYVPYGWHARQA
jgi:3',5'-cyclic-AMP phosphodiesterase